MMIMVRLLHQPFIFIPIVVTVLFLLQGSCRCFDTKSLNSSAVKVHWLSGEATWYGPPNGAGTDGGACGYGNAVGRAPFNSMISAGGSSIFQSGQGCGTCYQVKCNSNVECSRKPVTVVIADECPGSESTHFDLSGIAFGAMAISGKDDRLRNVGKLQVEYRRVLCNFLGVTITFKIDSGSNPYYFSTVVEYLDGDGDLSSLDLQEASGNHVWRPMQRLWGAVWILNSGAKLSAPFSLKLRAADSGKIVVARNVIPSGWKPGDTYRSHVEF